MAEGGCRFSDPVHPFPRPRPSALKWGVRFHHFLPLSLSFDDRVASGGEPAPVLRAMIEALGNGPQPIEDQHG
jgi:hypothetical protein